jgi:uncharacterized membrane protein
LVSSFDRGGNTREQAVAVMRPQFLKYWDHVRSSFWFVPAVMVGGAMALAVVGAIVDDPMTQWLSLTFNWSFQMEADGASTVLQIIAGSMITIAGVVFSMTLVALSLAAFQLGPRLLTNFMSDTRTQFVLGTFISTFVYCLLVLRTIRRAEDVAFVPHLSVTLGVVFAVASVGVLIYFIHHVSVSIQANAIAARIGKDFVEKVDHLFPTDIGYEGKYATTAPPDSSLTDSLDWNSWSVTADRDGYIELIDGNSLLALAVKENLVVRLERKPGNYIVAGYPLVSISPGDRVTHKLVKQIQSVFVFGHQRTSEQDIEFSVNQLVEMAVRALSPGVNDPFTAIACVDNLGAALCRLAALHMPSPYRHDRHNQLRLIVRTDTFPEIVDAAFNQIRQNSGSCAAVTIRLLDTIAIIARFVHRPEDRDTLLRHAEMITRGASDELPEPEDRQAVENRWQALASI